MCLHAGDQHGTVLCSVYVTFDFLHADADIFTPFQPNLNKLWHLWELVRELLRRAQAALAVRVSG